VDPVPAGIIAQRAERDFGRPIMINVAVPAGAAAGQMIQVQTPTGESVQVQVPAGLQPGQSFLMHDACFGSPAEQALAASIVASGGELHVGKPKFGKTKFGQTTKYGVCTPFATPILNAAGAAIATIRVNGADAPVTIELPDGSVAVTLRSNDGLSASMFASGYALSGSAGNDFGEVETRTTAGLDCSCGTAGIELLVGGRPVLSFHEPPQPWVLPFVILTCCLGAACINCMPCMSGPSYDVLKGHDHVGVVTKRGGCGGFLRAGGCGGWIPQSTQSVKSNDPAVLRASLNMLAVHCYRCQFGDARHTYGFT